MNFIMLFFSFCFILHDDMHSGTVKRIENQYPPQLLTFGIVNSKWIDNEYAEDTESLLDQVVCYIDSRDEKYSSDQHSNLDGQWNFPWPMRSENSGVSADSNKNGDGKKQCNRFSNISTDNEIIKQIGLIQAVTNISAKFSSNCDDLNTVISHIDTDKTRTIVGKLTCNDGIERTSNFWFFCQFQFSSVKLSDGEIRYLQRGLASPEYLIQLFKDGYGLWCLNNGSLEYCEKYFERSDLRKKVIQWWTIWLSNKFEFNSSFGLTDDSLFKLIPGIRYSCVNKPIGFTENINKLFKSFLETEEGLKDMCILNTNWTPEKNWGVIYMNKDTRYSQSSWNFLISFFKDVDLTFGLSTYALTYGNWPSLKQYVSQLKRMQSIKPNGGLIERSLVIPAIYLQEQLTNGVFNPFSSVVDAVESYIPNMPKLDDVSSIIPSISTVSNVALHPLNSLASYWDNSSDDNNLAQNVTNSGIETLNGENIDSEVPIEPRNNSTKSHISIGNDNITTENSGSYLLGHTKQGSIVTHDQYMFSNVNNGWELVKLVIYEINGILFVLIFDSEYQDVNNLAEFYIKMSLKLDSIYEKYFTDLVINQLKLFENHIKDDSSFVSAWKSDFTFIIYDDNRYWTSMKNIPPDYETLKYQIPEKLYMVEQNINSDQSELQMVRTLSLIQDKKLQSVISNNVSPSKNWTVDEKIIKLSKGQWCLFKPFSDTKWVVVVKPISNVGIKSDKLSANDNTLSNQRIGSIFGDDVKKWLDWVNNNGYIE